MPDKYVSKVVLSNGTVLMDLTGDDVTAENVMSGKQFHLRSGEPAVGEMLVPELKQASGSADLDVADENGNVILRLSNGHIETKNFNSRSVPAAPVSNGTYVLTCVVSNGTASYSWESTS